MRGADNYWTTLGIAPTGDERSIKRAYARLLKTTRPEDDPAAFQALHDAYQYSLRVAPQWAHAPAEDAEEAKDAMSASPEARADDAPVPAATDAASPRLSSDPVTSPAAARAMPAAPVTPAAAPVTAPALGTAPLAQQPVDLDLRPGAADTPQPAPPAKTAWQQGAALWQAFLADQGDQLQQAASATSPPGAIQQLTALQASGQLDSLAVSEAFELHAIRQAARADCPPALRAALVAHFGWDDEHSHLVRLDPGAATEALERYRAHRALLALRERARDDASLQVLLADTVPRRSSRTLSRKFVQALRANLWEIRHQHPELLAHGLNPQVIDWWQHKADHARYYISTAVWSLVLACLLYVGAQFVLSAGAMLALKGTPERHTQTAITFGLCAVLSFGLLAWRALKAPRDEAPAPWGNRALALLFYALAPGKERQLAWLGQVLACLLLMLVAQPPPALRWAILLVLGVGALNGLFMARHAVPATRLISVVMSTLIFARWLSDDLYSAHHYIASLLAAICIASLALRGSAPLLEDLNVTPAALGRARVAWLAAAAALSVAIAVHWLPLTTGQLLATMACFGGLLLTRMNAAPLVFFPLALLTALAFSDKTLMHLQSQPRATLLLWGLFVVGFFIAVSLGKSLRRGVHSS